MGRAPHTTPASLIGLKRQAARLALFIIYAYARILHRLTERVFSMLTSVFGPERCLSLADQIQTSIMLHYNTSKRRGQWQ